MASFFTRKLLILVSLTSLAGVFFNALIAHSPTLGLILLILSVFSTGSLVGRPMFEGGTKSESMLLGAQVFAAVLALAGAIAYYAAPTSQIEFLILYSIAVVLAILFSKSVPEADELDSLHQEPAQRPWILPVVALVVFGFSIAAWWVATRAQIDVPLRSIWDAVPSVALLAYFIASATVGLLLYLRGRLSLIATMLLFFSGISLAAFAYPAGYGFDPFIHRATVEHIAQFGTITPKPFYYIGQYALELFAMHVFQLPLHGVDTLLLPVLATLFLIPSAAYGLRRSLSPHAFALFIVFLFPLADLISSTPQGLAYIFTASALFLTLPLLSGDKSRGVIAGGVLFSLAAFSVHPLAGIPALIYLTLVFLWRFVPSRSMKIAALVVASLLGAVSTPVVFLLQAKLSGLALTVQWQHLFTRIPSTFVPQFTSQFSSQFDLLYLAINNLVPILLVLNVCAAVVIFRKKFSKGFLLPFLAAGIWFCNYWFLSSLLEFDFLIEYERQNYALRLETLTHIFLLPLAGYALTLALFSRPTSRLLKAAIVITCALLITANIYSAYPRHDNYARSAGFNVAKTDFDAVYAVASHAEERDYVVLANQAVSAAALESFGFLRYYHGDIFYYPIPTGGELYEIYLQMADDFPSRENALSALDLTGAERVYFVLNDYWWQSEIVAERAKAEADEWFSIDNGAVFIFVYDRE